MQWDAFGLELSHTAQAMVGGWNALAVAAFPDSRERGLAHDSAYRDGNLGVLLGDVSVFLINTKGAGSHP